MLVKVSCIDDSLPWHERYCCSYPAKFPEKYVPPQHLTHRSACVQRESFDVIGKVGFGRDFAASKYIDSPVNAFQQLTDDLEESTLRQINPWRKYSLSKVRQPASAGIHQRCS